MVKRTRQFLNINLGLKEECALITFNNEIKRFTKFSPTPGHARITALRNMTQEGFAKDLIIDLASAFRVLYPHWFTNGRGTLADGTAKDCTQVCIEVIEKLNASNGHQFDSLTRLFDISGDNAIATGRRPLAHTDQGQGKRTRTRTRRTTCKCHSDKPVVVRGWCAKCYARINSLAKTGIFIELLSKGAMMEVLNAPRPTKRKPLYVMAQEIIKKYEELEGIDAETTATA